MNAVATIPRMNREIVEMRRLILDFLSRYWWAVLFYLACLAIFSLAYDPMSAGMVLLFGPVLLASDHSRGAFGVYRTLPVAHSLLARTLWFECVLLAPLAYALLCPVLLLVVSAFPNLFMFTVRETLHRAVFVIIFGIGHSAALLLLVTSYQSSGITKDWWRWLSLMAGGFWGVVIARGNFWPGSGETGLYYLDPWDIALLVTVPVMVAFSHARSAAITAGRAVRGRDVTGAPPRHPRSRPGEWAGFWAPETIQLSALFLLAATILVAPILMGAGEPVQLRLAKYVQMAILFSSILPLYWFMSLRTLRALPVTSIQLTLMLLALPTAMVTAMTAGLVILCAVMGAPQMMWQCVTAGFVSLGFGCFLCAIYARLGEKASVVLTMFLLICITQAMELLPPFSPFIALAAFFFLLQTIRSSSKGYQRKSFKTAQ